MLVPNRHQSTDSYRYGFQGQEKDDEIKGEGNSLNYTFRMHDPRAGRFFAVDPLTKDYPHYTPYSFSGNKVIAYLELEGLEEINYFVSQRQKYKGLDLTLKLASESGIMKELKEEFKNKNQGVDIYIVVLQMEDGYGELLGRTFYFANNGTKYDAMSRAGENGDSNWYLGHLLSEKQIEGVNNGSGYKNIVIVALDEEEVIAAPKELFYEKEATLTLGHEIKLHALDYKDKKNDTSGKDEHADGFADEHYRSDFSPRYDYIKKDSPMGKMKEKIEKTVEKRKKNDAKVKPQPTVKS